MKIYSLCLLFLFFLPACQKNSFQDPFWQENNKLKVLSTIAMIDDLVKEVGGDYVDTLPLIRGELDPHSYELVKGDDEKFARADIIFYNGLGLEHGFSLRQNLEKNPKAHAVAEILLKEDSDLVLVVDGQYDPHVWMDIALWMRTLGPITAALSEKDPEHKEIFERNAQDVRKKLEHADHMAFQTLQAIDAKKRYLITSHDAFNYFTRHYLAVPGELDWKKRCEAPEGLAPIAQMSVADILSILKHIETYHVLTVFPESNVSKDSLNKIVSAAKEKGFELYLCSEALYSDAMGNATSYLDMMAHNVSVIAKGLKGEK